MFIKIKPIKDESVLPWENDFQLEKSIPFPRKLSIVIPIYNSAEFLEKTLRSLLLNDLTDVELILMDGESDDNTMDIVYHYKEMFSVIESKKDKGQSDAINKGYKHASGDIFYWLNGDDIILPNTLSKVKEFFSDNPNCDVMVGNAYMTEIDFKPINHFVFSKEKLQFDHLIDYAKNHLVQPSVFFTRKAWLKVGPLDIHDHYAMDADLFIGMSKEYTMYHLNVDIAYSVYHEDCKTRGARAESIIALALVQIKYGGLEKAKNTLNILVDLYHQLENDNSQGNTSLVKVLQSKLARCEKEFERRQNYFIRNDLECKL